MPLDRPIVISFAQPGMFNEHGEYEDGHTVLFSVWAELRDANFTDLAQVGGQQNRGTKTYRVRYLELLGQASSRALTLNDGTRDENNAVIEYSIDDFREVVGRGSTMRKRFQDFTVLYEN